MTEQPSNDLNQRIATRVRELRAMRALTLEALAERSGVSRSMISLIERGECSPTAVVLERIATGLDVPLASLFDAPVKSISPIARIADQVQWRDPGSGYLRRNISPPGIASPIQIVEVDFPPNASVAFDTAGRNHHQHQQVWVFDGAIEVTVGAETHVLRKGDCLAFLLDRPTAFRNRTRKPARYAVVISSQPGNLP
jgi:transcriptional regulator with XRE-family HTH domain